MIFEAEVRRIEDIPSQYLCCAFQTERTIVRTGVHLLVDPSRCMTSNVICPECHNLIRGARGVLVVRWMDPKFNSLFPHSNYFIFVDYLHIDEKPYTKENQ